MSSSHNRHKINSEHTIYNDIISLRKDIDMKIVFNLGTYLQLYSFEQQKIFTLQLTT